jgi:hypothetical protein
MIDPLASFPLPLNTAAPAGPGWYIVLDTADDMSWWRDELIFAPSQGRAEAMYREAAAGAGHTPETVFVYPTNFYHYIPDDLPGYTAIAESNEFEAGDIAISISLNQHVVKAVTVSGKAGLVDLLPVAIRVQYQHPDCSMVGLLRALMAHLVVTEAERRGTVRLH